MTCRPESTNFWFDHSTSCNKLCVVGVLVRSVRTSHACNFQESRQSGLQLDEILATPLSGAFYKHFTSRFFRFWRKRETVFFWAQVIQTFEKCLFHRAVKLKSRARPRHKSLSFRASGDFKHLWGILRWFWRKIVPFLCRFRDWSKSIGGGGVGRSIWKYGW